MKKAVCVIAMLAFVAMATAEVEFFFTSSADAWGLKPGVAGTADPFIPSLFGGVDYYYGYQLSPTAGALTRDDVPASLIAGNPNSIPDAVVDPAAGQFAYIWVHFDENEPLSNKLSGIQDLYIEGATKTSYYVTDAPRWDGALTVANMTLNPQSMIAVTSVGFSNSRTDSATNMYFGGGFTGGSHLGDRTGLLGAASWDAVEQIVHGSVTLVNTSVDGVNAPWRFLNGVHVVGIPEPASMMLIGLAGLFLRRR